MRPTVAIMTEIAQETVISVTQSMNGWSGSAAALGPSVAAASGPLRSQAVLLMLWSAPRSRSTAFFRMMIERGDFTAVHEPFSYLAEFGYAEAGGVRVTSAPEL